MDIRPAVNVGRDSPYRQSVWARVALLALSVGLYVVVAVLVFPSFEPGVAVLWLLPMTVAGMLFGIWGGLVAGILTLPINLGLFAAIGDQDAVVLMLHTAQTTGGIIGLLTVAALGGVTGYLRAVYLRLQLELEQHRRTAEALRDSESLYRTLLEAAPVGIGLSNRAGKLLVYNKQMLSPGGYTPEDIAQVESVTDLYADPDIRVRLMTELRTKGQVNRHPVAFKQKNGGTYNTLMSLRPVTFRGKPVTMALVEDVTDLERGQQAMAQRNAMLETLTELSRAVSVTLEMGPILTNVARAAANAIGATSAYVDLFDREAQTAVCLAEYMSPQANPLERVSDIGYSYSYEQLGGIFDQFQKRDYFVAHLSDPDLHEGLREILTQYGGQSIMGVRLEAEGSIIGYIEVWETRRHREFTDEEIGFIRAITQQVSMTIENARLFEQLEAQRAMLEEAVDVRTQELRSANAHMQALDQIKSEFVANVSHELRTPITNLKLYHELLSKSADNTEKYVEIVTRETRRLEDIIENLLQLSRLDHQSHIDRLGRVDINALTRQYVADRPLLAQSRGLTLTLIAESGLARVRADEGLMGQALSNLMTNALSYTPPGGSVTILTQKKKQNGEEWVGFSVRDTGPGISPEEKDEIFERFYRGESGRESGLPGTGLGLSIVKEIVERYGGRVELESEPGEGSTFTVWIPAIQGKDDDLS